MRQKSASILSHIMNFDEEVNFIGSVINCIPVVQYRQNEDTYQ